jgi:flagellar protein FlgJ
MTVNSQANSVYTDFRGLSQLQYKAATDSPKALKEVGQHFEALFIQMMLKSMREATPDDPYFSGKGEALYRDLFDKQISMTMAKKSQLGLADLIVNQLRHNIPSQNSNQNKDVQPQAANQPLSPKAAIDRDGRVSAGAVDKSAYATPSAFLKDIWPHAQQAAKQLNVDPHILVAQAALETGWGKSIIRHPDGSSSNNLFGIKAGATWHKDTASVATLEYRDGIAIKEHARFRAYDSLAESFQDYVDFLQNNPRYKNALASVGDPRQFAAALQGAGYATDPQYADKIQNVLNGDTMASAVADLKLNSGQPIV